MHIEKEFPKVKIVLNKDIINFLKTGDVSVKNCDCNLCNKLHVKPEQIYTFYQPVVKYTKVPHIEDTYELEKSDYWVRKSEIQC